MTKQEVLEKLKFDMELRGRTKSTIKNYTTHVRIFQDYYDKPADQMREPEIAKFLHYLLTEKGNTATSVNTYNSSLRFLYGETLDILLNPKKIPRASETRKIPNLPTKQELGYLFYLTKNLKYKAIFMTVY